MINFINFLLPIHIENLITNLLPVKWELNIWIVIAINVYNFHQERFIQSSLDRNISQLAITLKWERITKPEEQNAWEVKL